MRAIATIAVGVAVAFFAFPGTAVAERTWSEGTPTRPFTIGVADGVVAGSVRSTPGVALERRVLWEYRGANEEFDPFSVEVLPSGNLLVASRSNEVLEFTRGGRVVWSYTRLKDDSRLSNTYGAQRLANGNTLITDRRADFVIEVTPAKQVVWQYGAVKDSTAPGSLVDPFFAQRLANGNTVITDNRGGNRVIEVRTSDYDAADPDLGFSASSIVWQYGEDGTAGLTNGRLVSPRHAVRLANGNTLITDAGDRDAEANRVIEVAPDGRIVWTFGTPGVAGRDETHLDRPSAAQRLANGNTLIVEEDGGRMLEVEPSGRISDWYGAGAMMPEGGSVSKLRGVYRGANGATILADQGNTRLVEIGYPLSGSLVSAPLSLGMPGVRKVISGMAAEVEAPAGTSVSLSYSLDNAAWKGSGTTVTLPEGSTATSIRYRLTLKSQSAAYTPLVKTVSVAFEVAPTKTAQTPASGSGATASSGRARTTSGAGQRGRTGAGTSGGSATAPAGPGTSLPGGAPSSGAVSPLASPSTEPNRSLTSGILLGAVGSDGVSGGDPDVSIRSSATAGGGAQGAALMLLAVLYFSGLGGPPLARALRPTIRTFRLLPKRG